MSQKITDNECIRNCSEGFTALGDDCISNQDFTDMFDSNESENFTTIFTDDEDDDDEEGSTTPDTTIEMTSMTSPRHEDNGDFIHHLTTHEHSLNSIEFTTTTTTKYDEYDFFYYHQRRRRAAVNN